MKTLTFIFGFTVCLLVDASAQNTVLGLNTNGITDKNKRALETKGPVGKTDFGEGLFKSGNHSLSAGFPSIIRDTNKIKRFSFNLYFGPGGRVPLSDSYYELWDDLAIGGVKYKASDGWVKAISANWPDYFYFLLRTDFDFLLSKNITPVQNKLFRQFSMLIFKDIHVKNALFGIRPLFTQKG